MGLVATALAPAETLADPWHQLQVELDAWGDAGRVATLWWRDDDAAVPSDALSEILQLHQDHGVALSLAVIPQRATNSLETALAAAVGPPDGLAVLQHGYAHQNHAPAKEKRVELGAHRPAAHILAELAVGWQRLASFPGAQPVLVPPWNRIAPHLLPLLPEIGFRGLSTFGPRRRGNPVSNLAQANTHVDPIDWRGDRGFVGESMALTGLIEHLQQRRHGTVDTDEPTGVLTHHADHPAALTRFLATLFSRTVSHPAVRWLTAAEVFPAAS